MPQVRASGPRGDQINKLSWPKQAIRGAFEIGMATVFFAKEVRRKSLRG